MKVSKPPDQFTMFVFFAFGASRIYFQENFDDYSLSRWQKPGKVRKGVQLGKVRTSIGDFWGQEAKWRGMETMDTRRNYLLTSNFSKVMDTRNKDLIVQYTVRINYNVDCSGQYIKLLDKSADTWTFSNNTKYELMFGPDICGATFRRTHVIIRYKGAEYPTLRPLNCIKDHLSHSYTLIIRANNTYEVDIDGEPIDQANLADRFDIPEDSQTMEPKPEDWDDEEFILDPNDKKPDDWADDEYIPDPDAVKPIDWDDSIHPWEAPLIVNPKYQGVWQQKMIKNPNYKGPWQPDVEIFGHFNSLKYIGLEFFQSCPGSLFDNFLVTDNETEAREILEEDFLRYKLDEVHSFDEKNRREAKAQELENIRRDRDMENHHDPDTFEDGKGESEKDYFIARRNQEARLRRKYIKGQFDEL